MRKWWKFVRRGPKVILPIITVVTSLVVARWLVATKPAPAEQRVTANAPPVAVVTVEKRDVCFPIHSQGTALGEPVGVGPLIRIARAGLCLLGSGKTLVCHARRRGGGGRP